ncbi:hypothetical protein BVRB_1g019020 [Beta vulgaris subsp. vulgaris]|nr:hypothetical protein BVRB_1g019020 [Beta vulgaris subsp. vulgaris]
MKSPLPSVNQAYHALLEEERQREITGSSTIDPEASAMAAFNKKFQSSFNHKTQTQTHDHQRNPQTFTNYRGNTFKKNNYYCDHCKCPGHSTERCYKLNGYPPNHKFYNNNGQNNGKGKKVVAYCHGSQEGNETGNASDQHMISQDQYNHLMDMITKAKCQQWNTKSEQPRQHIYRHVSR